VSSHLRGDDLRLRQVLSNLVGNAVKFTNHGYVTVLVRSASGNKNDSAFDLVEFTVQDSGIGLDQGKIEELFRPFTQADNSATRNFGGTGLGLSISRHLVQLMGGEITVESEAGQGASFRFTLPFERAEADRVDAPDTKHSIAETPSHSPFQQLASLGSGRAKDREPPASDEERQASGRILLVEDNAVNQKVARLTLKRLGFEVTLAANGSEAVERAKREHFDLICMDLQMPVMDGLEATRQIRAPDSSAARTPIIAMTGHAFREDYQRCLANGMNDYISKPFDLLEFKKKIDHLLPSPDEDSVKDSSVALPS